MLGQSDYLSADQVCKITEMDKVSVSRAVMKLLNKKLVTRKFSSRDRRRSILRLSKTGISTYEKIVPIVTDFENRLIQGLSQRERRQLGRLLRRLESRASIL